MAQKGEDYRILVADDEPEVVDLVRMMLEMDGGYTVLSAGDGQQAVDRARADRPDLILLDVRMPKLSGLMVLDHLRAEPATANIPVIMLSVVTTYPDVRMALERGAVAYLPKPFELREMTRLVARVLDMDLDERQALRERALSNVGKEW
jgi:two-component system alkaline phosphatase synthesis response regulator PhoP